MKKYFKLFFVLLILMNSGARAQNYLEFEPKFQSLSTNSGQTVYGYIDISCYGNDIGSASFGIYYNDPTPDDGYIGHDPAFGALYPNETEEVEFTFNKNVTSNTTVLYPFLIQWFDSFGSPYTSYFNIEVTYYASTCSLQAPSNKSTSNITANSAQINWNSVSGASGYHSEYKATNSSNWITVNNGSSNTSHTITGLSSDTNYHWRVRSKCSNGAYGNWSNNVNFTTLEKINCTLSFPSGIIYDEKTYNSFRARWDQVPGNNGYVLQYTPIGGPTFNLVLPINTTLKVVTGLQEHYTYIVKIATICPDGSWGVWSSSRYVSTLENCPFDIIRSNYHSVEGTHQVYIAENNIYSRHWGIIANTEIEYNAGNSVILENGFYADYGSDFWARIEGCSPGTGGTPGTEKIVKPSEEITEIEKYITVFPNPTTGRFTLESDDKMLQWTLTNNLGNFRKDQSLQGNNTKKTVIDISQFPTGMYYLSIFFEDGEIVQKTIVKE